MISYIKKLFAPKVLEPLDPKEIQVYQYIINRTAQTLTKIFAAEMKDPSSVSYKVVQQYGLEKVGLGLYQASYKHALKEVEQIISEVEQMKSRLKETSK